MIRKAHSGPQQIVRLLPQTMALSVSQPTVPEELSAIASVLHEAFDGLRVLYAQRLSQPCLVFIYSTIGAIASLTVRGDGAVTRKEFIAWVEDFLLAGSSLCCSATDLYAARCVSRMHSYWLDLAEVGAYG